VIAYLRAAIEADRLIGAEPEKYSELIAKVTGIEAEVNYLFHGPLGLQTRDYTWKPEYRQAVATSIDTLRLLKKHDSDLTADSFIDDQYIRAAFKAAGLDYDAQLKIYDKLALKAKDTRTGKPISDPKRAAQVWVEGEALVRHYASAESAFADVKKLEQAGKKIRVVYAHDRNLGIKLLANQAWFAVDDKSQINAFLLKDAATAWAQSNKGKVVDYAGARSQAAQVAAAR
jgi:NitT/TauT family transport system substrate-binding protein